MRSEARAYETAASALPNLRPARAAPHRHTGPLAPFLNPAAASHAFEPVLADLLPAQHLCARPKRTVPSRAAQRRAGWDGAEAAERRRNEPDYAQASPPYPQRTTPSAAPPLALTTPNTSSRPALPPAKCSPCGAAGGARRAEACGLGRRGKPRCKTRPTAQRPLRCANSRHKHSFAAAHHGGELSSCTI